MKTDVLIIGGGVAGLTLAIKLVKRNIEVAVVEKDPTLGKVYKGELIQPKTIQIFDRLGMLQQFKEEWNEFSDIGITEFNQENNPLLEQTMSYSLLKNPYNYAAMMPHSLIKAKLMNEAKQYSTYTSFQPATFQRLENEHTAIIKRDGEEQAIEADYIIGAEGLSSKIRSHIGASRSRELYNHDFLTVSFSGPSELRIGEMISTQDRFLGLFPLPNNDVRTVYLVRKGEFKEMRKRSLEEFYSRYLSLYPELDGYVQKIQSWKDIQLMVPIKQHASHYVKDHFALIGDAAHSVHPMAGEGMNLAIQDADVLGELIGDMYEANQQFHSSWLTQYELVRRKRVSAVLSLSHLGGLVYGRSGSLWQRNRSFLIKRLAQNKSLLSKYMFNISGLGIWPFSINDGKRLFKSENEQSLQQKMNKRTFTEEEDYPWKKKMR